MPVNNTVSNARKILKNHSKATPKIEAERFYVNSGNNQMPLDIPSATKIIIGKLRCLVDRIDAMETRKLHASRCKVWHKPHGQEEKDAILRYADRKIEMYIIQLSRWVSKYSKLYTITLRREKIDIPYLIQQAKKVSIMRVLANHGIEPNKQKKILCISPQHSDTNPSMHVYNDRVHCFSCGASYDAIGAEQVLSRDNFVEVVKRLGT